MKRSTIYTLVALIVLMLIAVYLFINKGSGTFKSEKSDFAFEDTASVKKIFMVDKDDRRILIERKSDAEWIVNGKYPVKRDVIFNLLVTINRVRVKAPVSKQAFETIIRNMAGESVKIEIYTEDKEPVKVYYVGGATHDHLGTYMLVENSSVPFITHIEGFRGFLTPRYSTNENEWRSTEIFSYGYGEIESVEVKHNRKPEESFVITDLGNNTFSVSAPGSPEVVDNPDTMKIYQYLSYFQKVHYEGVEETKTKSYIDSVRNGFPINVISVSDKSGRRTVIKTFPKPVPPGIDMFGDSVESDIDRLYATINDSDFVVIQYFVFDPITRYKSYFKKNQ